MPLHDGTPDVEYDVDIEVMELPYAFRTTLSTVPREVPYLAAFPLALGGSRPRVGIVWQAGEWDTRRWIALHELAPLFSETGICWFSLQLDADIEYAFNDSISINFGASNLLDEYPDRQDDNYNAAGNFPYDVIAPIGFNGRYVYAGVRFATSSSNEVASASSGPVAVSVTSPLFGSPWESTSRREWEPRATAKVGRTAVRVRRLRA